MKYPCIALFFITFLYSQINYESQIQPIFNTNCVSCHTPGGSATLDLTSYNGVMAGGWTGPAITSGDYVNSLLYQRLILPQFTAGSMPPNVPLSQAQIDLIAQWIDEGAGNLLSVNDYLISREFILHQNYPNPFNGITTIDYSIPSASHILFKIYDMSGKEIKTLHNGYHNSGSATKIWDGKDKNSQLVASGIYFYSIVSGQSSLVKKLTLVK